MAGSAGLYRRSHGSGPVPVLGVHCALASGRALAPLAAALPQITLHSFDLPGHGRSPAWVGGPGADIQRAATQAAAATAGGPFHVFGHSFGATVALRLALEAPDRVLSLTLAEPVLFAALRGTPAWADLCARQAPFDTALAAGDRLAAARLFHGMWGGGGPGFDTLPEAVRAGWVQRIHLIAEQRPALHDDTVGLLHPGRLEGLRIPVTLLHGAHCPPAIRAIEDALAARLPDAARVRVAGAGHMAPLTHPAQVADALRATIARARPPA